MEVRFEQNTINTQLDTIQKLRDRQFIDDGDTNTKRFKFRNVPADYFTLEEYKKLDDDGVIITGMAIYLRMPIASLTEEVPPGIRGRDIVDANGNPIGVKTYDEWAENRLKRANDGNTEILMSANYASTSPSREEIEIFEEDINVFEVLEQKRCLNYLSTDDWTPPPGVGDPAPVFIDKTASYYYQFWEVDGEVFDFIHAQRLVFAWFDSQPGANITDKFNTLDDENKIAVISFAILGDTAEAKALIEATVSNKEERWRLRRWATVRARAARQVRFDDFYDYMVDSFKEDAIQTRIDTVFDSRLKDQYIYNGNSRQSDDLLVAGVLNVNWYTQFTTGDVAYSDETLETVYDRATDILDSDRY